MPDTLGTIRHGARERAKASGVSPRDVDLLLADLIERDPVYVIAHDDKMISDERLAEFERKLARRLDGEPVQYIRGHCEFFGRKFHVDARALIPRPETELICERALELSKPGMRVIDVGCGSGAIAVTMALENRDLRVVATERSLDALLVARANARGLGAPVKFVKADLLAPFLGQFELILSNPPYIPDEEIPGLQREVGEHEPHIALSGGPGGLHLMKRLIMEADSLLSPGGTMFLEMGWNQSRRITEFGNENGWEVETLTDLSGSHRCAVFRRSA